MSLALIGFHVVNDAVFRFDFGSNLVLVALVFLPVFEWTSFWARSSRWRGAPMGAKPWGIVSVL